MYVKIDHLSTISMEGVPDCERVDLIEIKL